MYIVPQGLPKGIGSICGSPNYETMGILSMFRLLREQQYYWFIHRADAASMSSSPGHKDCFLLWTMQTLGPWQSFHIFCPIGHLQSWCFSNMTSLDLYKMIVFFKCVTSFSLKRKLFLWKIGGGGQLKWIYVIGRKHLPTAADWRHINLFSWLWSPKCISMLLSVIKSETYFYSGWRVRSRTY